MKFLFSTENTENENLLFSFSGCFLFSFSLKMFSEIQQNTFSSSFSVFSENESRKQPNQTKLTNLNINLKFYIKELHKLLR